MGYDIWICFGSNVTPEEEEEGEKEEEKEVKGEGEEGNGACLEMQESLPAAQCDHPDQDRTHQSVSTLYPPYKPGFDADDFELPEGFDGKFETIFARHNLDQSRHITSREELQQLSLAVVYEFQLGMTQQEVDRAVDAAYKACGKIAWPLQETKKWFLFEFMRKNKLDGASALGTRDGCITFCADSRAGVGVGSGGIRDENLWVVGQDAWGEGYGPEHAPAAEEEGDDANEEPAEEPAALGDDGLGFMDSIAAYVDTQLTGHDDNQLAALGGGRQEQVVAGFREHVGGISSAFSEGLSTLDIQCDVKVDLAGVSSGVELILGSFQGLFKILFGFCQVVSTLAMNLPSVPWPISLTGVWDAVGVVANVDLLGGLSAECIDTGHRYN